MVLTDSSSIYNNKYSILIQLTVIDKNYPPVIVLPSVIDVLIENTVFYSPDLLYFYYNSPIASDAEGDTIIM